MAGRQPPVPGTVHAAGHPGRLLRADLQLHLADLTQLHAVPPDAVPDLPAAELRELSRYEPGRRRRLAHAGRLLAHAALPGGGDVVVDEHGRPHLAGPARLDFSTSHDGGLLVLVVAPVRCGVDVEDSDDLDEVADRFLGVGERGAPRVLWSAKESVAKAIGTGQRAGLRTIRFDGDPATRWAGVTWRGRRVPLRTRVVDLGARHLAVTAWRAACAGVRTWRPDGEGPRWWLAENDRATESTALAEAGAALRTQLSTVGG